MSTNVPLYVRFIPHFLFVLLIYRTLFICNQIPKYLIRARVSYSNSGFVEMTEEGSGNAISTLSNGTPSTTMSTCRKPLLTLWARRGVFLLDKQLVYLPDCKRLLRSGENQSWRDKSWLLGAAEVWFFRNVHSPESMLDLLSSCDNFRRLIDFPDKPATKEEEEYPLAYVFMPYRNIGQTVRLFRMIYQPQNTYCINYDTKSEHNYKTAIIKLASCFPDNVHINPHPEPIVYARYSILHSVMECLKVLRTSGRKWRYVQIVSWNDFPLKTNWEMVRIFKTLNGSQDCELLDNERPDFVTNEAGNGEFITNSVIRPVPPAGITIYKGSFATSMSREFIDWMFTDPTAIRFYQYFDHKSVCPEEFYWSSLIHNVELNPPGGYPGQCYMFYGAAKKRKPFLSRYQVWNFRKGPDRRCRSLYSTHASCVFGIRDMETLLNRMELFAHKLYEEFQPALLYCLEEWYWQRACMGDTGMEMSYYQTMPSVLYHGLPQEDKDRYICSTV